MRRLLRLLVEPKTRTSGSVRGWHFHLVHQLFPLGDARGFYQREVALVVDRYSHTKLRVVLTP